MNGYIHLGSKYANTNSQWIVLRIWLQLCSTLLNFIWGNWKFFLCVHPACVYIQMNVDLKYTSQNCTPMLLLYTNEWMENETHIPSFAQLYSHKPQCTRATFCYCMSKHLCKLGYGHMLKVLCFSLPSLWSCLRQVKDTPWLYIIMVRLSCHLCSVTDQGVFEKVMLLYELRMLLG